MKVDEERPCANGCTMPDGKLRAATHGAFCSRCHGRYANALSMAADVVTHIVSLITFKGRMDDKVDTSGEQPVPFNLQAFHDANETYRRLVYWTKVWAGKLGVQPPAQVSKVWRDDNGKVVGFRKGAPAHEAGRNVQHVARWLRDRLDDIMASQSDDLDYWGEDLADVYRLNAKYPREMQARFADVACPDDECRGKIAIYPPQDFMDDERIVCMKCGRWFEPKDYAFIVNVMEQKAKDDKKHEQVARHLAKKYAIGQ